MARMFHSEMYPAQMAYRMYLQNYPHGDLKGVFYRYHKAENDFKKAKEKAKRTAKSKKRKKAGVEEEEKRSSNSP